MQPGKDSEFKSRPRSMVCICLCVSLLLLLVFPVTEAPSITIETLPASDVPIQITPGSSTRHEVAGGHKHEFEIAVGQGELLRFSIDKGDLMVAATVHGPTGAKLLEYVNHDFEVVEVSFPADMAGTYTIEIRSHERTNTPRQYELKVKDLTTVTVAGRKDSEARQELARGETLRASWMSASLKQAIPEYEKAALTWISTADFLNASRATLKSGEIYFLLSKYSEALKRFEDAIVLARKAGDAITQSRALSSMGRLFCYLGDNTQAQKHVTRARDLVAGEVNQSRMARNAYGLALGNLAEVNIAKGYLTKSSRLLDEARNFLHDDRRSIAKVHLFTGYITGTIGNASKAESEISKALELYRATSDKLGEGRALTALGLVFTDKSQQHEAIKVHRSAIETFQQIGDQYSEAVAVSALGQVYEHLKEYPVALSNYEKVLRLSESIRSLDLAAAATFKVATMHRQMHRIDQALAYNERCLKLSRAAGKVRIEAIALSEIATIYASQGQHEQALKQLRTISKFYETGNDPRGHATALNTEGDFLLRHGYTSGALDAYRRALALSESIGDKDALVTTLSNLARAYSKLSDFDLALSLIKRSLTIIEELRTNVNSPGLRVSYFSVERKHFDVCINILMQLEQLRPGNGYGAEALLVSEQSRARSLVDLLWESKADLRKGAPVELVNRERELEGLIRAQARYELELELNGGDAAEVAEVADEMTKLKSEYQELQLRLREQNPQLLSASRLLPMTLAEIQHELRDSETMLLEYFLGTERSYLWAVTHNSLHMYQLPAGTAIEHAAIEFYNSTTARQGSDRETSHDYQTNVEASDKLYQEKGSRLSDMVLGPVAEQLGNRRLVIVTEGALQYVPFEALPIPFAKFDDPGEFENFHEFLMIKKHEFVGLPSMSTLKAIRAEKNPRSSPGKLIAIIADPVFSISDDRVQGETPSSSMVRVASKENGEESATQPPALRGGGPARLAYSSVEADAISAAAPRGTTIVAKGFDANRETAMSARIGEYQIVHFATHGFLDSEHPELSSIVLSMVDSEGVAQNGLMPLHDIHSLDLSAQLTVLSACQTALGKDIKGEGFVGLTQSFMSAGAKSVVASLWKVDDRATAILMADFYQQMLQEGMTPAAALRSAKLRMMREKQWRAPYYWAGFVLQGEYTNHIAVDRNSWLRPSLLLLLVMILISSGLILHKRWRRPRRN